MKNIIALCLLISLKSNLVLAWFNMPIYEPPTTYVCDKLDNYYSDEGLKELAVIGSEFLHGSLKELFPEYEIRDGGRGDKHGTVYFMLHESGDQPDLAIKKYTVEKYKKEFSDEVPNSVKVQNRAAAVGAALPILFHGFLIEKGGSLLRFVVTPRGEGNRRDCSQDRDGEYIGGVAPKDPHQGNMIIYNGRLFYNDYDLHDENMDPRTFKRKE